MPEPSEPMAASKNANVCSVRRLMPSAEACHGCSASAASARPTLPRSMRHKRNTQTTAISMAIAAKTAGEAGNQSRGIFDIPSAPRVTDCQFSTMVRAIKCIAIVSTPKPSGSSLSDNSAKKSDKTITRAAATAMAASNGHSKRATSTQTA